MLTREAGSPYMQNLLRPRPGDLPVRAGFGLVREYGTTLNAGRVPASGISTDTSPFGLGRCIGATHVRTAWGTDQILAIHTLLSFTGNLRWTSNTGDDVYGQRAVFLAGVVAIVHDLHTGRFSEVVLHEQDTQEVDLSVVFPNYSTRFDDNRSRWVKVTREPKWALFAPLHSADVGVEQFNVVVTIDGLGQWTYRPIDAPRIGNKQMDSLDWTVLGPNMGEDGWFSPLSLANGLSPPADGIAFLRPGELGVVTAMTTFNGDRIVYGSGNDIWFSDPRLPQAIAVDNVYSLPTPDPITLLAPVRSMIFVATQGGQCWVYQPALTGNQDTGVLTALSRSDGCIWPQAGCVGGNGVFFVADGGVYFYGGGVTLEWLSEPIDRLWSDPQSLALPLTDFYTKQGITAMESVQLPAQFDIREQMRTARLAWDDDKKTLYCSCDDVTLCWTQGFGWSVWLYQTHAGDSRSVSGAANVTAPTLVPIREDLYLLGGPDAMFYDRPEDSALHEAVTDKSCYLLKLGRGGAVDRSMCAQPSKFDAWAFTLAGYIVPGDVVRLTINAVNYDYTVLEGDDFTAIYAASAGAAAADPLYDAISWEYGAGIIAKTAGDMAIAVSASVVAPGVGTYTATRVQDGAEPDVVDADLEDERQPIGGYVKFEAVGAPTTDDGALFVGPPIVLPIGYVWPGAITGETVQTYWWPVKFAGTSGFAGSPPSIWSLEFSFDNDLWQPICTTATVGEFGFVLPSERLASEAGYQRGAPDATHHVWVTLVGVPDPNGDTVEIAFNGNTPPAGTWTTQPNLNTSVIGPDTLLYLGFRYLGEDPAQTAIFPKSALWLYPEVTEAISGTGAAQFSIASYFWQSGRYPTQQAELAGKQQAVDWVVKTREVEDGGNQVRCQGVFVTAMSLGNGEDDVVPLWRYGPLNTATSTDWRDYSAQALDFNSVPPGNSETNGIDVYPRLTPVGSPYADPVANTFDNQSKWGSLASPAHGNVLIGDPATDTLATTDGSQGVRVSVMLHGTMNAPGEGLRLGRIAAVLRRMGLAQRWR